MYNSIFVNILLGITNFIKNLYRKSLIYRLLRYMGQLTRAYISGSKIICLFWSMDNIFLSSIFYRLARGLFKLLDLVLDFLWALREKVFKNTFSSQALGFYMGSLEGGLRLIYISMIIFGVVFSVLSIAGFLVMTYKISMGILVLGLLGLIINGYEGGILRGSRVFSFFYDLFELDGEEDRWW